MGNGVRQLDTPNCIAIAIDSDDVIYVTYTAALQKLLELALHQH